MASTDEMLREVEDCIDQLVETFLNKPYIFYTESDLHCYLYHLMMEKKELAKPVRVKTSEGQDVESILVHKEYPTKGFYKRNRDRDSVRKDKGGSRGHFDLSIWNPNLLSESVFSSSGGENEEETSVGIEISLNEHWRTAEYHVQWDLMKLNDERNKVEQGYILFFVRDYPYDRVGKENKYFIERLTERFSNEPEIKIIYVENCKGRLVHGLVSNTGFKDYVKLH